jgi:4-hydroxy-tetrahydrodipicolinate reductase
VLDDPSLSAPIYGTAEDALRHPCDVFVEYTSPEVAKANILAASRRAPTSWSERRD